MTELAQLIRLQAPKKSPNKCGGNVSNTIKVVLGWIVILGSIACTAQDYRSTYVLDETDYSCESPGSQMKHFTKTGETSVASLVAFEAGICLLDGRKKEKTQKQDVAKAVEWFRKSAELDSIRSQPKAGYVGYRFLGQGSPSVPADPEMAVMWLRFGAKNWRDSMAMYNLGLAYLKGDVLGKDNKQAVDWLTEAVKLQNASAATVLAEIYKEGKIVPQNMDLAAALSKMAPQYATEEADRGARDRASSEQLEATLGQIRADSHAAMLSTLTQGISNLAVQATTPNAIQTAANEQVSQINATAARQQNASAQDELNKALARQANAGTTQTTTQTPSHIDDGMIYFYSYDKSYCGGSLFNPNDATSKADAKKGCERSGKTCSVSTVSKISIAHLACAPAMY
jgi:TPR repeat protein